MASRDKLDFHWRLRGSLAAAALLLMSGAAAAAEPPAEAPTRWVTPVCPVVTGMTEAQAEYVLVRLFQVAKDAGAPMVEDGVCEPNLYIVATADPEGLVKAWGRREPHIFSDAPAEEVRKFQETPRAVRAWYNTRLDRLTTASDSPFEGLEGLPRNIAVAHHAVDTRLHSNSPYVLASEIMVVDSTQAAGVKVGALADYLAMAALAQRKTDASSGDARSILSLFDTAAGASRPEGLTARDKAFLHALYHTDLEDFHQGAAIASRVDQSLHGEQRTR